MIPTFETRRLILKPVTLEDAPNWQKHFNNYEIIQHLSDRVPWPYPENGAEDFIKNIILPNQGKDKWVWGIFEKGTSELIGAVDLWRKGVPEHRGFWLSQKHWNKGYMTEAVRPVTDYAFGHLGFETLIFSNAKGNIQSRRVKEKAGAKFIGTKPSKLVNPKYTESELWEFTKADWYKSFIGNYKDHQEEDISHYKGSDELLALCCPIGKILGLTKIGIHVDVLKPGRRMSWPHAEMCEEEFMYVIEGNPDVWMDGHLHSLKPGDFVAWPAGTGIAHTILNNSQSNCLILSGGEATKLENKIYYPLHPKKNEECKANGSLWEDCPKHELGPHDGVPRKL